MLYVLYDIVLHLSFLAALPFFIFKMITASKYRQGIAERFGLVRSSTLEKIGKKRPVWIHAVSVGETKAVMPLLKLLKQRRPDVKVVFSTVTATGNGVAQKEGKGLIDALVFFPLDFSWAVRNAINKINPQAFIVVEKEIWPNFFNELGKRNTPVIIVNGTISERTFRRYKLLSSYVKNIFGKINFFCARTKEDLDRATAAGIGNGKGIVTGNLKFDMDMPKIEERALLSLKNALGINPGEMVFVAGSTHPGEEDLIIGAYKRLLGDFKDLRLIIAPRHPERFNEVAALLSRNNIQYSRRTSGKGEQAVLLDTVGELLMVYSFSSVSFVGGSLVNIGGHNLLEPALFEKPVLYGPYISSCAQMAEMLEAAGAGFRANNADELVDIAERLLSDERLRIDAGKKAKNVLEANRGATVKSFNIINNFIKGKR